MPNQYKNKVIYGDQTLMDITDTTASSEDVLEGEVFYSANGARSVGTLGDATTSTHGLMSAADKTKLDGIAAGATAITVENILTSTSTTNALSAAQGKALNDTKAPIDSPIFTTSLTVGSRSQNETVGTNSVVIGANSKATSNNAIAIGEGATASGPASIAVGYYVDATNYGSNAFGVSAYANGYTAHAVGNDVYAYGDYTQAMGRGIIAHGRATHIFGEYNIDSHASVAGNNRGTYVEIVGNGTGGNERSNARALDWNGNEYLKGALYVGCTNDGSNGSKVATETYVSTAISNIILPTKVSDLINDSGFLTSVPLMTGATANTDGAAGLIPAPTSADAEKFFRGDGTWQDGGRPMVILSYGNSTWNDFIEAYNNHVIVYCRASSNSNPATGAQGRMAFMAYVNNGNAPTEVEFQYYRSVSSHTATQMSDQVYIYKLNKNSGWSVTVREGGLKQIVEGTGISVSYSSNKITVNTDIATATTSTNGLMSSTDKNNLDELYTFFSTTGLEIDSSGYITQTI